MLVVAGRLVFDLVNFRLPFENRHQIMDEIPNFCG